ncbi:Haptoglobin Zonulin Haptoglobin alpha chain Haptoglobin beta chain [Triplophysa tibetana]|uniref:Haptoglobin Zonulin Haptoglobin alpha chain Haptoglobin beta chain n=1 Tax=Triplophysa tibetana TaxID=1572043 RepID=A0A5A9PSA0_9TELE|nr:Haptoglobin Zonulin Haptoglobin alpha chain Haptoglobin beta chain [Triplophysa tibetana]
MKWLSVAVLLTGSIACLPNVSQGLDRVSENVSALRRRRMIGGSPTAPVPWHAMVYLSENILDGGFAGGALIAERWILTAGRNLFVKKSRNDTRGNEPLIPKVYLGISKRSDAQASTEVAVEKVFLHPGFQNTSDWDNDLALIKLKEPANFSESIMPIPLPEIGDNQEEQKGERGIIAGWGWGRLFTSAPMLKFLALPIVPCQGEYQAKVLASTPNVTDTQFCTGPSNYQENVCLGDAGGALAFLNTNTNAVYAAGVLSFDKACSVEDHAVYIKISAYLPWIHSVMRGDLHEFAARRTSFINRMLTRHFALS